jgi:hypothetical protein
MLLVRVLMEAEFGARNVTVDQAPYSARNAPTGEMRLARSAGTRDATNADNPRVTPAIVVTEGLNGFNP